MSKNRDLQALPDNLPLLAQIDSGVANAESLYAVSYLLYTIRAGRLTDRRIDHVRRNGDADEIAHQEMVIQLAKAQPLLVDLQLDLVSSDGMLEHLLSHVAAKQSKDAELGQHSIRGVRCLKPSDPEIGWSTSDQVDRLNEFLLEVSCKDLCREFDPERINRQNVYKRFGWLEISPQQLQASLDPLLEKTKKFYQRVSEANLAVVSIRWG